MASIRDVVKHYDAQTVGGRVMVVDGDKRTVVGQHDHEGNFEWTEEGLALRDAVDAKPKGKKKPAEAPLVEDEIPAEE